MDLAALGTGLFGLFTEGVAALLAYREVHGKATDAAREANETEAVMRQLLLKLAERGIERPG